MSLPQIANLQFTADEVIESTTSEAVHATFDWDFTTGDFRLIDGKLVKLTGIEYLKVWIQKALRTVAGTLIYKGTTYGSEHHTLIGRSFHQDFSRAEYERMIRAALLQNDAITLVDSFSFSQSGARLTINFRVGSIYGETDGAVTV
ncbi:DUF2634 domain-containing protein [Paenibacillus oleatilyticus]|uniref:DUF2634 domain-containing protein n=1 Tax=Paenibacillus oleatilyticus TaxID=2594886 RepID=UPI001C1FA934|nr:DUF2634 domain-containing protein [Paenibacillus oleatilyticus]MBU7320269.1 DUF2634 domain-containing protein [Paenibacillus oleatilyticus]